MLGTWMEIWEGSLRADVNVSVKTGTDKLGHLWNENVNSIKFMQMAIEYEANNKLNF